MPDFTHGNKFPIEDKSFLSGKKHQELSTWAVCWDAAGMLEPQLLAVWENKKKTNQGGQTEVFRAAVLSPATAILNFACCN